LGGEMLSNTLDFSNRKKNFQIISVRPYICEHDHVLYGSKLSFSIFHLVPKVRGKEKLINIKFVRLITFKFSSKELLMIYLTNTKYHKGMPSHLNLNY
jgi:hypothetical protein